MAELISLSVYNLQPPKLNTATPIVESVFQRAFSPESITGAEGLSDAQRIATGLPRIYSKVVTNEGGVQKEYLVAETVAQILTKAG